MEEVWVPESLGGGKSLTVHKWLCGTLYYMADIDILRSVCYSHYPHPNTLFLYMNLSHGYYGLA